MSECLGIELNADAFGRIGVNLCGAPEDVDWPHPCPPSVGNALSRDATGCVWSPPLVHGLEGWARQSPDCVSLCTFSTSSAFTNSNVVSLTVTNPEACRVISLFVVTFYRWQFAMAAGDHMPQFWRRVTGVDNADPGWVLVYSDESRDDTASKEFGTSDAWTITDLAPGASRTVTIGQRANTAAGSGEGTISNLEAAIAVIGMSTD